MSIKILHTSDWHLGKKLYKKDRIAEQELFLNWLTTEIKNKVIDILVVAGDIFDVPNPPNTAIKLYFDFLKRTSEECNVEIFIISGNHDSASFLQAPSTILNKHNIHIYTQFPSETENNTFEFTKDSKTVEIKSIPYFRSYDLNNNFKKNLHDISQTEYLKLITKVSNDWNKDDSYKLLISHHAYGEFTASKSEHTLSLAGLESIPVNTIAQTADYVALGHIHKPQPMSRDKDIYYCGSPIPLRFSETQTKKIKLVTIDKNKSNVKDIDLPLFRDLIRIKATSTNIIEKIKSLNESTCPLPSWLEIQVSLDSPMPNLLLDIKEILSKKEIELISFYPTYKNENEEDNDNEEVLKLNISDIFQNYYQQKYPNSQETPKEILQEFKNLIAQDQDED